MWDEHFVQPPLRPHKMHSSATSDTKAMEPMPGMRCRKLVDSTRQHLLGQKRTRPPALLHKQLASKRCQKRRTEHVQLPSKWLSYNQLQAINHVGGISPLQDETRSRIKKSVADRFSDVNIERKACAVTDSWVFRHEACCVSINDLPFEAMRRVLTPKEWTTKAIEEYYDCAKIDSRLKGMLLSPRGFEHTTTGVVVWMSKNALQSLRTTVKTVVGSKSGEVRAPRFAIADCFVAGTYEEVDDATVIERQTTGLVQTRGLVKVIYGGPGNMLQSHLLSWDNREATVANSIPSMPRQEDFQVILAGPFTSNQEATILKHHECNGQRVHNLHMLLKRVNILYKDVPANEAFDGQDNSSQLITRIDSDDNASNNLVDQARSRQQTVAQPSITVDDTSELQIAESQTLLVETNVDTGQDDRLDRAMASITGKKAVYVAHRSTSFLQSDDEQYLERLYSHLFTFGIGGFKAQRKNQYSRRDVVLHYLNLSTNRFAEDPLFKLQMFDYLATLEVKNGVFVRVRYDPTIATKAARVTPEQLQATMEAQKKKRHAARTEQTYSVSRDEKDALSVVKSMTASTAKMWGSNEERDGFQRKVQAMTIMYGEPSIFWTLTPNPDASIAVAFWSGQDLPGSPKELASCTSVNMPGSAAMAKLVMQNTTIQAHYYRLCCRLLLEELFGWDMQANKPKVEPGIFGHMEAFFYALEQQGRLRVHHHGVAWVAGMPKTHGDWASILSSPESRSKFEIYCESIFSSNLPVFANVGFIPCPATPCTGALEELSIPPKYKHWLKAGTAAPLVAQCLTCLVKYTEAEISSSVIESNWRQLDTNHQSLVTHDAVNEISLRFGGLDSDKATAEVQLSRLLLKDQVHAYGHTRSCVKGQKATRCRYRFYRQIEASTRLTEENEMVYARYLGNQWLNTFIELWRQLLHFNMDARALWSGQALQAIWYAMQYVSKRQTVLDNVAVVELALQRRIARESTDTRSKSEFQQGVGRLMSLAFASSGVMEIGGPLATTILLEGEAATFSCQFVILALVEALNLMNCEDVEAVIINRDNHLVISTSMGKYTSRPSCLEDVCWYDFCAWFKDGNQSLSEAGISCSFQSDDPDTLLLHVHEHGISRYEYPKMPEIIGPRMPDVRTLSDPEATTKAELYYRMALLLHCPFRDPTRFLDEAQSAKPRYEAWNPQSDSTVVRALEFHQQYYFGLDEAEKYRASLDDDDSSETCEDPDVLDRALVNEDNTSSRASDLMLVPSDYCSITIPTSTEETEPSLAEFELASNISSLLQTNITQAMAHHSHNRTGEVLSKPVVAKDVLRFVQQFQSSGSVDSLLHVQSDITATTCVTVRLLRRATRDLRHKTNPAEPIDLPSFPSIQEVSQAFGLNELQHIALVHIAVPLLHKIAGVALEDQPNCPFDNSPLIITGPGGTGKSRIVDAVRMLATKWQRPNCVAVVASTGIAAANLNGKTIHSSIGLGINLVKLPKHLAQPSRDLITAWDPVLCVLADELSMVDLTLFGLWEEAVGNLKEARTATFGGLIVALMFDHCQLLPVKGYPLFKIPKHNKPFNPAQERGSRVYKAVTKAIYLTENMRFATDPEWGSWLASARIGQWTPAMRSFLEDVRPPEPTQDPVPFLQVVSTDNAFRTRINNAATHIALSTLPRPGSIYCVQAQISSGTSSSDMQRLCELPDNRTSNIPVSLPVYIGMPVRIKANQCSPKGVANGATGTVYHIEWLADTTFTNKANGLCMPSIPPANIFVQVHSSTSTARYPGLPSHWPSSVMPVHPASGSFKIDSRSKHSTSIKGFPLIPAFGTTVHGIQGETRDALVVSDLRPPTIGSVDHHALYVSLSRVRTRKGLYWIGRKPTPVDFDYFVPSAEVLTENTRLQALAQETLRRFR